MRFEALPGLGAERLPISEFDCAGGLWLCDFSCASHHVHCESQFQHVAILSFFPQPLLAATPGCTQLLTGLASGFSGLLVKDDSV